ncbi:MAG: ATP-binding cassette domain-containing protein [Bdellovibrionales bacterium]
MFRVPSFKLSYKSTKVIESEALNLSEGVHIILGANGSGKSSTLKYLAGLLPDSNKRYFDKGQDCLYLPPTSELHPELFVLDLLDIFNLPEKLVSESYFKIDHLANKRLSECSSGELQRILLSCYLKQNKQVLLLDEPTNFLDPRFEKILAQEILSLSASKCILIASHQLSWLSHFLSQPALFFHNRQISSFDSLENLVQSPEMETAFELKIQLLPHPNYNSKVITY